MSSETIQIMARIQELLQATPERHQNEDYKKIVSDVKLYLSKYCSHRIIQDYIDIDVEYGKVIHYCVNCNETFPEIN